MTQQKAGYPVDYSQGSADAGKDRLREMADVATDKVKNVGRHKLLNYATGAGIF